MKRKASKKDKRRLVLISVISICLISVLVKTCYSSWVTLFQNQKDISSLTIKYEDLLQAESELRSEVKKLQDPEYVARYARETYLYSLPGERIIKTD